MPITVLGDVSSLDEAINLANNTEYGLTAGIFSEDDTDIQLWNEPHNLRRRNCSSIAQYFNERNKWKLESFGRRQPEFRYLYLYAECGPVCNNINFRHYYYAADHANICIDRSALSEFSSACTTAEFNECN